MKLRNIIFNSEEDYWNNTSTLNEIIGKKQLVFLIEDDNGERFGYYSNNSLQEIYLSLQQADNKSFHFNLNSNGRLSNALCGLESRWIEEYFAFFCVKRILIVEMK